MCTVLPVLLICSTTPTGRPVRHGAEWVAVLLSVALAEEQVPPYCTHGGVQDTTRHSTGPVFDHGIWVLHWPYRNWLQATRRWSQVVVLQWQV